MARMLHGQRKLWQPGIRSFINLPQPFFHYHNEDYEYSYRRMLAVMHMRYREFGFLYGRPRRKLLDTLRIIKTIWKSEPLTVKEKWKWFVYNQQQHKAGKDAYDAFRKALDESEERLDALHEKICHISQSQKRPF